MFYAFYIFQNLIAEFTNCYIEKNTVKIVHRTQMPHPSPLQVKYKDMTPEQKKW
jgi:hypothetical protein